MRVAPLLWPLCDQRPDPGHCDNCSCRQSRPRFSKCIWIAANEILCSQPRINLAARPEIMSVDAFVPGPLMIGGITEASAT
jgi:hypothetical protein